MNAARGRAPLGVWLLAAGSAAALGVSASWTPTEFPKLELCWLRRWTELSCPGCGLTRSFCALSHGDLGGAWGFHPFGIVVYTLAVTLVLWPLVVWRWPMLALGLVRSRIVIWVGAALFSAFLVHGVLRAVGEIGARSP